MSRLCRHRIKLGDKGSYHFISPSSRARVTMAVTVGRLPRLPVMTRDPLPPFPPQQIAAVCNFFTYIRYIQQGLVRHDGKLKTPPHVLGLTGESDRFRLTAVSSCSAEQMFWEVMRLRREMTTARLGFYIADQG